MADIIPVEVCSACKCWRVTGATGRDVKPTKTSWKTPCYACRTWLEKDPANVFPPLTPNDLQTDLQPEPPPLSAG